MRQLEEQKRIDRVQKAVNDLKAVVGVTDAWIDDFNEGAYGFNVDILVNSSYTCNHRYFLPVNLRKLSAQCGAILRSKHGLRAHVIQSPKKVRDYYSRYWHVECLTWDDNRIRFDVYA